MNKKKTITNELTSLESNDPTINKPRLCKLIIGYFRAITTPISIDLDDIVILVGPNNSGKSSILKAYEIAMSQGSKDATLRLEDFPNETILPDKYPTIELITIVYDNSPGKQWIDSSSGENLVKERWVWKNPGAPTRQGFNVEKNDWDDQVPWGAPNVANSRRPIPHRIDAFADPDTQTKEIIEILNNILTDRIKSGSSLGTEPSAYEKLLETINEFRKNIVSDAENEIHDIENGISDIISKIFPGYIVEFDARPESDTEKSINLFKSGPTLKMGPADGYKSTVDRHGSGARRTLLWSALKFIEKDWS